MRAFQFRVYALAVRFLCPIAVLALTDTEEMGQSYIFISYFSFAAAISGFELAVTFASKYLRSKTERQRSIILSAFLLNQIVLASVISVPVGVIIANMIGIRSTLVPLLIFAIVSEAIVNEFGRFYWNIGLVLKPSKRDLMRAFIFLVSVLGSVLLYAKVLTFFTLLTITSGNFAILMIDFNNLNSEVNNIYRKQLPTIQKIVLRVRRSVYSSIPHFLQMQLFGIQPLLERTLIEKTLGLTNVAAFAFTISIVQTGVGLMLLPYISMVKSRIIGARDMIEWEAAKKMSFTLLHVIFLVSAVLGGIVFLMIPIFNTMTDKHLTISTMLILTVYATTVSSVFCSGVSPVITKGGAGIKANFHALLIFSPLFFALIFPLEMELGNVSLYLIATVAILSMTYRIYFIIKLKKII